MLRRIADERGFTLPEVLVVILVIGVLAAIALPAFAGQQGKAADASAKELAHSAQVAAETYATDHDGSYAGLSGAAIHGYEATIALTGAGGGAYLASVSSSASGYTLVVRSPRSSESFTLTRTGGAFTRTCSPSGGGCVSGTW